MIDTGIRRDLRAGDPTTTPEQLSRTAAPGAGPLRIVRPDPDPPPATPGLRRVGCDGDRTAAPLLHGDRPVIRALRRRRHLRASLVQSVYVVASVALALVLARIGVGPTIPATTAVPMLFALAGGLVGFIGIVYSLLFVVVQWASSTFSPRLNLFRDRPLVWHSFGFFVGTIV